MHQQHQFVCDPVCISCVSIGKDDAMGMATPQGQMCTDSICCMLQQLISSSLAAGVCRSAPDGEDSEESLDDADGSGYDPLRGISISSERLTAALSAVGLGDMLRDLNTGPGQGGSAGPVQHGPSSTHTPAVPASSASEAAGSRVGSRAAAATQAASGTAQSDVAAGGATSAAVAAPDTAVGPGHTSGGDGNAAEGGAVSPGGRKKPRPCAMCGQLFTKLHRCARCKEVLYCSREHQVAHWKLVHKLECQQK
jgi:hypothetical protein